MNYVFLLIVRRAVDKKVSKDEATDVCKLIAQDIIKVQSSQRSKCKRPYWLRFVNGKPFFRHAPTSWNESSCTRVNDETQENPK